MYASSPFYCSDLQIPSCCDHLSQTLLPVWLQVSPHLDPLHMPFLPPGPFCWCHLKIQIGDQLMPNILFSSLFLILSFPHPSHSIHEQVVTALPNMHVCVWFMCVWCVYNLWEYISLYFLLQVSSCLLSSPATHLSFHAVLHSHHYCFQIISTPASYQIKCSFEVLTIW